MPVGRRGAAVRWEAVAPGPRWVALAVSQAERPRAWPGRVEARRHRAAQAAMFPRTGPAALAAAAWQPAAAPLAALVAGPELEVQRVALGGMVAVATSEAVAWGRVAAA